MSNVIPSWLLVDTRHALHNWLESPEQWESKSPWADKRVRLAVNYALDRQAINEASSSGSVRRPGSLSTGDGLRLQTEPIPMIRRKPSNSG